MSDSPLISVVIPSYNYARYIGTAIDSVLGQRYPNVEVVISENCSTDETEAVVGRYSDNPRVRVFRNRHNVGITPNLNTGLSRARGEYVSFLSADDFLLPNHLERAIETLRRHPQIDVVYTGAFFVTESGTPYAVRRLYGQMPFDYVDARDEFPALLTATCHICLPTMVCRRALYDELGALDEKLRIASDWEITLRFAAAGLRFAYLRDPSVCVRLHAPQASGADGYVRTGDDVREFIYLLDRYATKEMHHRFRGSEMQIAAHLRAKFQILASIAPRDTLTQEVSDHVDRTIARLSELRAGCGNEADARTPGRVSVIVRSTGRYPLLLESLESIAKQTVTNWEAIVVEDGTPVDARALLDALPYAPKIRHARLEATAVPAAARNYGLRLARGRWIAYLDEGDRFAGEHLETLLGAVRKSGSRAARCCAALVVSEYDSTGTVRAELARQDGVFYESQDNGLLQVAAALPLACVMHSRDLLGEVAPFREGLPILEDYEFLLRLRGVCQLASTEETTVEVHRPLGASRYAQNWRFYARALDAIYAAHPPERKCDSTTSKRREHRDLVEAAMGSFDELTKTPEGVVRLTRILCGRE